MKMIKNLLNIRIADNEQRFLFITTLLMIMLGSFSGVSLCKEINTTMSQRFLAGCGITACVFSVFVNAVWKGKFRKTFIKYFAIIASIESFVAFSLSICLAFSWNTTVFAVSRLIYQSLICNFIMKGFLVIETSLWSGENLENFKNSRNCIMDIGCILGFFLSFVFQPSTRIAVIFWGICCILDDIGWIYLFIKRRKVILGE